jgi:hypothetical protein
MNSRRHFLGLVTWEQRSSEPYIMKVPRHFLMENVLCVKPNQFIPLGAPMKGFEGKELPAQVCNLLLDENWVSEKLSRFGESTGHVKEQCFLIDGIQKEQTKP